MAELCSSRIRRKFNPVTNLNRVISASIHGILQTQLTHIPHDHSQTTQTTGIPYLWVVNLKDR